MLGGRASIRQAPTGSSNWPKIRRVNLGRQVKSVRARATGRVQLLFDLHNYLLHSEAFSSPIHAVSACSKQEGESYSRSTCIYLFANHLNVANNCAPFKINSLSFKFRLQILFLSINSAEGGVARVQT